ncbi:hypothetical protein HY628_00060 [Candidatus Uhrbacteria bacterium]|nr:hypothetical protein [Candidatus Uhrbacteria bacterium]
MQDKIKVRLASLKGTASTLAIMRAAEWLRWLEAAARLTFHPPDFITASDEGEVIFEWLVGSRKLSLWIGENKAEFLKIWGPNIHTEMEAEDAADQEKILSAWHWLCAAHERL